MTSNLAFENRTAGAGRCYFVSTTVLPAVLCFFDEHRESPRCGSQPFTSLGNLWPRAAENNIWRLWIVFFAQANCYNFAVYCWQVPLFGAPETGADLVAGVVTANAERFRHPRDYTNTHTYFFDKLGPINWRPAVLPNWSYNAATCSPTA